MTDLDPIALDLLDLASAAYVTDRHTRRGHPDSARRGRNLDFTVAVLPEMLWQVGQLARALAPPEPFAALQREFPQLLDLPVDALSPTGAVDLYRSYVREWTRDPHPLVRQFLPAPEVAA